MAVLFSHLTGSLFVTGSVSSSLGFHGPNSISSSLQIDHDGTTNFVANEHIDHSSITIGGTGGVTGGGDITANRTLTLDTADSQFTTGVVAALPTGTVSGSVQITDGSGIVSSSTQIDNRFFDIDNLVSASSIGSSAQGEVALTTNGVAASAVDLGLQTGDSPSFAGLTLSSLSNQASEATAVMINGSNVIGTRELGSNAFTSTTIGTTSEALTVDDTTLALNSGTTFNGSPGKTISIKADGVDSAQIADDAIDSEHLTDGAIDTAHIGDDQVTYAKIQNVSATNRILGRDSAGAGVIEEITPANLRTMINVADGATANTGTVDTTGTPADNQIAIFTDSNTLEGSSNLTFNGTDFVVGTNISGSGLLSISGTGTSRFTSHLYAHCLGIGTDPSGVAGSIRATNDIIAYYSSDINLKNYISNIEDPIEKVKQLNGVTFEWIDAPEIHSNEGSDIGVIAQEVEKVLPEIVTTRDNGYKAVRYEKIVALLIEAVKEQQSQIEELKKKL